ncbi:MAG: ABC-F family ATP-binding cassette domain-containing protein [Muribaculaceae bacterium]|nr:ABC-F family ATP-binding cassette domain-containing protein [Muribaculaceae bacterium]
MISIQNITVEFVAGAPLLDGISFVINKRDRIGLAGRNGAGKSTLMKIIAGLQTPTGGIVALPNDVSVGYLPQQMELTDTLTVEQEVAKAFAHVDELRAHLDRMNLQLAERTDYESEGYAQLIERVTELNDLLSMEEADNHQAEAERTLLGLGFRREDFKRPTAEFSGGWRMRIELAKLLLSRPDVLLLDEPTNHLDILSIRWLENFLINRSRSALMVVSHDRAFLDNVTRRTIEISLGKIYDYGVAYSKFLDLRQERIEQQTRAYLNQQKQIHDTEAFIERFRYKATKSVQVQSRIKQLAKIERIEVDEIDSRKLNLRFPPAPRSGDFPVIAENVGKSYGALRVFDNADFTLRRGEKVAFAGRNGEGKSTMIKCIMGEIDHSGVIRLGHNVSIGYFAQNQAQMLDQNLTVFETIDNVATGPLRTRVRDLLAAFLFRGEDDINKPVRVLSGGEKARLAMLQLLLQPVNLLILDEPTNHLDIPSKEVLRDAINAFDGSAIIVSHDRQFLDGLVDKVYEFASGKVREHIGGIYDYLAKIALEDTPQKPTSQQSSQPKQQAADAHAPKPGVNSYKERREREKLLRAGRKKVEEAEAEIAAIEAEIKQLEDTIAAGGDLPADIYTQHATLTRRLENAMSVWELHTLDLEALTQSLSNS